MVNYTILSATYSVMCIIHIRTYMVQGDYKGHAEATDQNNQQLFCIDINIRLN